MNKGLLTIFSFLLVSSFAIAKEIKGMSFSAPNKEVFDRDIQPIKKLNANWISIVPYGFLQNNVVSYDSEWQWWGEKEEGVRETIALCQAANLKIMLKGLLDIIHGPVKIYPVLAYSKFH